MTDSISNVLAFPRKSPAANKLAGQIEDILDAVEQLSVAEVVGVLELIKTRLIIDMLRGDT